MKKFLALVLVFAMMFTMAACSGSSGDTIKVGVIGCYTGEVAVYGNTPFQGIELYVDELNANGGINGKKVELVKYDDKGDATEAVNAYNKLVSADNVVAIIGSVTSTPTIAVSQASEADGVPIITATATHLDVTAYGNNMFRACFVDDLQAKTMANVAKANGVTKAAVIFNNSDSYSTGVQESFVKYCGELGIEIVASESYGKDATDFSAQLTNIAAKNPEIIFVPEYYNNVYLVAKQAREMGVTVPFYGVDGCDGVLGIEGADVSYLEGILFCNHYTTADESEVVQSFLSNYKAKYNEDPTSFSALGYDAALIMCNAIEAAGVTEASPEAYAKVIEAVRASATDGVTGHITYENADGTPTKATKVIEIKGGEYTFYGEY